MRTSGWRIVGALWFGMAAAGCHNNNQDSGFGVAWIIGRSSRLVESED